MRFYVADFQRYFYKLTLCYIYHYNYNCNGINPCIIFTDTWNLNLKTMSLSVYIQTWLSLDTMSNLPQCISCLSVAEENTITKESHKEKSLFGFMVLESYEFIMVGKHGSQTKNLRGNF